MQNKFFQNLFVFDLANNHMGDLEHGLRIIREIHEVCRPFDFKVAFKLQYRELDTFIHPEFKNRKDIKYVKRFTETKLSEQRLMKLKDEIDRLGFVSVCTAFDEPSVDLINKHGFDIIKIASCSLTDWPLLEKIVQTQKTLIASTAGASLNDIDKVVTFLEHREKSFCIMHCVAEYPTNNGHLQLGQIDFLKHRYPTVPIGYSTHEIPDNVDAIKLAIAKGAVVFERHVGIPTPRYSLNDYSSTPQQIQHWLNAAKEAQQICGVTEKRMDVSPKECLELRALQRGVFAKRTIAKGEKITSSNIFLAIPNVDKQLIANDLSKYSEYTALSEIKENRPLLLQDLDQRNLRDRVLQIISHISRLVSDSKVSLPEKVDFELSHHYGIERFDDWGAAIMSCINREYCKKLVILLKGQKHPIHRHVKKEETFQVLYGDVTVNLNGTVKDYKAGDIVVVERGVNHSFSSRGGTIIEEISTTHYVGDSYYEDNQIMTNTNRKTQMTFWSDWLYKPIS
ncbi:MAG: N-acetylneuraminate synthase family protein [Deltaproteobacteria bacterium]|nr:N-acetylneuraminate synthase family protein [Deltaproteobacteria bacterium]